MIIKTVLVYHFVDPDLEIKIFFGKERTTKEANKKGVDFEIGD